MRRRRGRLVAGGQCRGRSSFLRVGECLIVSSTWRAAPRDRRRDGPGEVSGTQKLVVWRLRSSPLGGMQDSRLHISAVPPPQREQETC